MANHAVQLQISINGRSLSIDKKNLVSLTVDRVMGDSANEFTLEVFDETAYQVESLFADTRNTEGDSLASITVLYSAAESLEISDTKSIMFSGIVLTYNVSFVGRATMLSIQGILTSGISNEAAAKWSFKRCSVCWADQDKPDEPVTFEGTDEYGNPCLMVNPTRLVERILNTYNSIDGVGGAFKIGNEFEETKDIPITSLPTLQSNMTAAEYISNVICPMSVLRGTNKAGFQYYVNSSGHNFRHSSFYDTDVKISLKMQFGYSNSRIISFSLAETGAIVMAGDFKDENGNLLISAGSLDKLYGQEALQFESNKYTNVQNVEQDYVKSYLDIRDNKSRYITSVKASDTNIGLSTSLSSSWENLKTLPFEATLTIWRRIFFSNSTRKLYIFNNIST